MNGNFALTDIVRFEKCEVYLGDFVSVFLDFVDYYSMDSPVQEKY